ncbi:MULTISPECIES: ABC transporter permease [Halocynthiibacter]|uniref:FtsX-like permease family protein n=1 Tax=Halocynthiibacter halioticoli TaxID=2986804 RepID=A0AAE3J2C5_9RHOB|nr:MULTISPECIES: FtsX-like permease family protein [Halocynthiibacter]MCV6825383.1 FtsX-like permease family protein [Halocynthiibacter halioticoli]MCW4058384.1 FtsX-like permease family protein [Halocynthiibacter sp. SDUM655004]
MKLWSQLTQSARIARRELRGGIAGFRVFLLCLALGVAAIAAVGSVREALQQGLENEGAAILGGDAELTFTYRFADDAEREWMEDTALAVSEIADFRSMAVKGSGDDAERGLTQIKAVDGLYPLYGDVGLSVGTLSDAFSDENGTPGAAMDQILADRLGLALGDRFSLGLQEFRLGAILEKEPDSAGMGFGLGPRTIVLKEDLSESGLLAPGTLFETKYRLKLPEGSDLEALKKEALDLFGDNGARWRDMRNGAPGISRFVDRIGAFLVLVGIAGLAVGGVGVSAAVRAYLEKKTEVIAILKTLGAERRVIFGAYVIQIGILSVIGVAIGLVLGAVLPLAVAPILEARLPIPAVVQVHWGALAEAAIYGVLAASLFTLWPLARSEKIRAAALFREVSGGPSGWPRPVYIVITAGILAALIGAAAYFSGVPKLAIWAAVGVTGALVLLAICAAGVRVFARHSARFAHGRSALRLALSAIGAPGGAATSVVLSLGLGLSILASVGQIDANLRDAIARGLPEIAPSYFFVDIQPDQIDPFRDQTLNTTGVDNIQTAPMLRGIITKINGQPARDVAGEHWVLRGDRGVTYADAPPKNSAIVEGEWWPENYSGPPLVSFSEVEGEEMGLKLGDTLTVNILGRDLTVEIASFRAVDFSDISMNFIMIFNPSALAGAPHSHIATVYAEESAEAGLVREISKEFPNVTAIRVRDAIDRVSEALGSIATATSLGAAATLITGFVVLIGAAAAGESARVFEAAVLRTLGASRATVLASFALRSAVLGAAAGGVAILAGGIAGWAVMTFVMETDFNFDIPSALGIVFGGALITLLAGLLFAWRPLSARPAQVLRAKE